MSRLRLLRFGLDLQLDEGWEADGQGGAGDGDAVEGALDGATEVNEQGADGFGYGHLSVSWMGCAKIARAKDGTAKAGFAPVGAQQRGAPGLPGC
jgi:hypothetical protein